MILEEIMKVPFGLHKDTNRYIGIDEAENGLRCGCICPSCKMELKARQGEENEHHFSHHRLAQIECEYSYWVAVRSMAKQIINDASVTKSKNKIGVFPLVPWTDSAPMQIMEVHLSPRIKEYQFDAVVNSSIGTYYIYLLTPSSEDGGRSRSHYNHQNRNNTFSPYLVMEIDIQKAKKHNNMASEHLRSLLRDDINKQWFSTHSSYLDYLKRQEYRMKTSLDITQSAKKIVGNIDYATYQRSKQKSSLLSDTQSILRNIGIKEKNASREIIETINNMVKFHDEMHQNINKARDDIYDYKELYRSGNLFFVGCHGEFYCIAFVGICYIVYTVEENKVRLLPVRHINSLWKLSKLLREYSKMKAEDLF